MSIRQILNNKKKFNRIARVVFNSVDKDGSGLIDMNEFGLVMSTISKDMSLPMPTKKEIKEVFSMLDTDDSGIISYEEFKVLIKAILESFE